jgi:predicted  nucleic acid-binding Zn-ribbon protein
LTASSSVDNDTRLAKTRGPTRTEFNRLRHEFEELASRQDATQRELAIQFQRIAELQAEIDVIRAAWSKIGPKAAVKRPRAR